MDSSKMLNILIEDGEYILKSGFIYASYQSWYTRAESILIRVFGEEWKELVTWEGFDREDMRYEISSTNRLKRSINYVKNAQKLISEPVALQTLTLKAADVVSQDVYVFISYAWANDNVVLAVDQWLRNKGINTKIDKRDFFAGSRIRDEIIRVMNQCKVILIFHSEQSKDKPWTQFERELAADIAMSSQGNEKECPRIIYIVIDDTPLPDVAEKNRIAIMAKGKRFDIVCDEIHQNILQLPRTTPDVDLSKWSDYTF